MSFGFGVKIEGVDGTKELLVKSNTLSVGKDYQNDVSLPISKASLKLAEVKEGFLLVHIYDDVKTKIFANDTVYQLEDLLKVFLKGDVIKIRTDCEVFMAIEDVNISYKVIKLEETKLKEVPKDYRKSFITKENFRFTLLTIAIAIFFLSLTSYASFKYLKNKPTIVKAADVKNEEAFEISYSTTKTKQFEGVGEKGVNKHESKKKTEQGGQAGKVPPSGAFIETAKIFDGSKTGGVLAVQEGAKNIIINRERSLFSKLDETLVEPIVTKDVSTESISTEKRFESAKAEEIHTGPAKKDVKTELVEAERLKVQSKAPEIRVVVGKRPEVEITSVLSKYKKGFEFIFIDEKKKDANLQGKVVIFFIVSNSGTVSRAEIYETDIKNKEFLDKILTLVKSIKFPPSDKGDTSIKLPLLFFPS